MKKTIGFAIGLLVYFTGRCGKRILLLEASM